MTKTTRFCGCPTNAPCNCQTFPCSGCGTPLDRDEVRWIDGVFGPIVRARTCKPCKAANDAASHQRHRDERLAKMRAYGQTPRAKRLKREAAARPENREQQRSRDAARRATQEGKRKTRDTHLRRLYGITADDFDRMLAEQGGRCAICRRTKEEAGGKGEHLHVDHDHETGVVRGLLCTACNTRLHRTSSLDWFRAALTYLASPSGAVPGGRYARRS